MENQIKIFENYLDRIKNPETPINLEMNELSALLRIREKISSIDFLKDFFSKRPNAIDNNYLDEFNLPKNYLNINSLEEYKIPSQIINNFFKQLNKIHLENNNLKKLRMAFSKYKIKSDDFNFQDLLTNSLIKILFKINNNILITKKQKIKNINKEEFESNKNKDIKDELFKKEIIIIQENNLINDIFLKKINLSLIIPLNKEVIFILSATNKNEEKIILNYSKLLNANSNFKKIFLNYLNLINTISKISFKRSSNIKYEIFKELLNFEVYYFQNYIKFNLIILSNNIQDSKYQIYINDKEIIKKNFSKEKNKIKIYFENYNFFLILNSIDNYYLIYSQIENMLNEYNNFCQENYTKSKYLYFNQDRLNEKVFFEFDKNKNLTNISNLLLKGFSFLINIPYELENLNLEIIENINFENLLREKESKKLIIDLYNESKDNHENNIISVFKILVDFIHSENGFNISFEEEEKDKIIKNEKNFESIKYNKNKGLDEAITEVEKSFKSSFSVNRDDIIKSFKELDIKKLNFKPEEINNTILSYYLNPDLKVENNNSISKKKINSKRSSTVLNIIGLKNNPIIKDFNKFDTRAIKLKKKGTSNSRKSSFNSSASIDLLEYDSSIEENIDDPNWDNLDILDENLYTYVWAMFDCIGIVDDFSFKKNIFLNFIKEVNKLYQLHNNPYHNFKHGIMVLYNCYFFIKNTNAGKYFDEVGISALLFSGLMHDIAHTGKNNFYEVNSISEIALSHNDFSVLESHHVATAFKLINKKKYNIFSEMDKENFKIFRKNCISMILATDMKNHFIKVPKFKEKVKNSLLNPFSNTINKENYNEQDYELFSEILLHTADLYVPTKDLDESFRWSDLVNLEFKNQYNSEKKNNLPIFPFYKDLDKPIVVCNNEIQFIDKIVKPLWVSLNSFLDNGLDYHIKNIDIVLEEWNNKLKKLKEKN